MIFETKDELDQYLRSISPIYATYSNTLWAKEKYSAAQLAILSVSCMEAYGIKNAIHATDIIAHSKTTGKW